MREYTDELTAVNLIAYIANDYIELSHDKVRWQRDNWRKACRSWLDKHYPIEEIKSEFKEDF